MGVGVGAGQFSPGGHGGGGGGGKGGDPGGGIDHMGGTTGTCSIVTGHCIACPFGVVLVYVAV